MIVRTYESMSNAMNGNAQRNRSSGRIFLGEDGKWYFHARGHGRSRDEREGPFVDKRGAQRVLERQVRDSSIRRSGLRWPRAWSPMRLLRRPSPAELPE